MNKKVQSVKGSIPNAQIMKCFCFFCMFLFLLFSLQHWSLKY